MRILFWLPITILSLALLLPSTSWSQSAEEEEAKGRLVEAKKEIEAQNFEKAREAAGAALRLYPSLYEAMMYKALAYEGLGELKRAKGLLRTFKQVSYSEEAKVLADAALARIQDKLGEQRKATVDEEEGEDWEDEEEDSDAAEVSNEDEQEAPAAKKVARMAVPLDMPEYPAGSEEFLSWMLYRQQLSLLELRRDTGIAFLAGGGALAGLGGGIAAAMAGASVQTINDPNIQAGYAAGMGAMFSGVVLVGVGLPLTIINALQVSKLSRSRTSTAQRRPRLDVQGGALALRF